MDSEKKVWSRREKKLARLPSNDLIQVALVCELNEDDSRKVNTIYLKNFSRTEIFYTIVGKGVEDQPGILKSRERAVIYVVSDRGNERLAVLSAPGLKLWKTYTMCNFIQDTDLFQEPVKGFVPLRLVQSSTPAVSIMGDGSDMVSKAATVALAMQARKQNGSRRYHPTKPAEAEKDKNVGLPYHRRRKSILMRFVRRFF